MYWTSSIGTLCFKPVSSHLECSRAVSPPARPSSPLGPAPSPPLPEPGQVLVVRRPKLQHLDIFCVCVSGQKQTQPRSCWDGYFRWWASSSSSETCVVSCSLKRQQGLCSSAFTAGAYFLYHGVLRVGGVCRPQPTELPHLDRQTPPPRAVPAIISSAPLCMCVSGWHS